MAALVEFGGQTVNLDIVWLIEADPDDDQRTILTAADIDAPEVVVMAPYAEVIAFLQALVVGIPNFEKWERTQTTGAMHK